MYLSRSPARHLGLIVIVGHPEFFEAIAIDPMDVSDVGDEKTSGESGEETARESVLVAH